MGHLKGLVKRNDKLAFYGVSEAGGAVTFHRMKGFTELSGSKNPIEYSRQYVDESFEQNDVVGYSPSLSYGFDQHAGNAVHDDIIKIHDHELVAEGAVRTLVFVDLTKPVGEQGAFEAVKREFAIVADSEGNSSEAYTYSGELKVKSEKVLGTAVSSDDWQTCTFSAV